MATEKSFKNVDVDVESARDISLPNANLRTRSYTRKTILIAVSWLILVNILLLHYPFGLLSSSTALFSCTRHHSSSSPSTPPNDDTQIIIYRVQTSIINVYNPQPTAPPKSNNGDNDLIKRQDFSSAPPPLTTPNTSQPPLATNTADTSSPPDPTSTPQALPKSVLPVAVGVGVGAGLGILIIGAAIAYLVIRKKRISKRESMHIGVKNRASLEMGGKGGERRPVMQREESRRVDRSVDGNVVGKPKDRTLVEERQVRFGAD